MEKYISYYRVSTKGQGESGLGLSAQNATVESFLEGRKAKVIESFTEIESGKNGSRPILKIAIEKCKDSGATLLIAKLDRLSRNVAFLFNLKEELESAGVNFIACDIPEANNTMVLGVMATMAQHEAEIISQRTKEGIEQSEKYKAGEWGNSQNLTQEAREKAWATISQKARTNENTRKAWHFIEPRRLQGISYAQIADELNKEGYRTPRDKKFHPAQVHKIYNRFSEHKPKRQKPMKRKYELEKLKRCAIELNEVLGLEPPIEIDNVDRHYLEDKLREAIALIMEADEFSNESEQIIKHYQ